MYASYEQDLTKADKYFLSKGGRATHIVFPYFDLVHGDGGTMIALGWAGTWEARFSYYDGVANLRAKTGNDLNAVLLPGESVRTGLVVLLPYKGRNYDDATNLWREWFMKYNLPKANAKGDPLMPFSTSFWANDTGLVNSDGSISERHFTWRPTLDKLVAENIITDFRWFDAGWYYDPAGNTVETDWYGTVGSWELDRHKWPGNSFRESNEACHALGMKVLVWFEPERVTHVEDLVANHGYKREWAIEGGGVMTNNIGDEACFEWTLSRVLKMMDENAVDMYREDNNSNPGYSWPYLDRKETEKHQLPRYGITENKCITAHYRLWDEIIKYCAQNGKCTFVDSCASGGGRNDIESLRRGIPLMRSDYDRTSSSLRLSQTSTFCKWIPFHGSSTKETLHQLEASSGEGSNSYVSRASLLPIYNISEAFRHNKDLNYNMMRKNIAEWKRICPLLTKDFYVLTPWHHESTREAWTAFAYDDPSSSESTVLAFRMEESDCDTFTAKLPFCDPNATYSIENVDQEGKITFESGAKLLNGFEIVLKEKKTSALYFICKTENA